MRSKTQEQREFEEWMFDSRGNADLSEDPDGTYSNSLMHWAWRAWHEATRRHTAIVMYAPPGELSKQVPVARH